MTAPGFIEDGISVIWKVELSATQCGWLDYDWCQLRNQKCDYKECPHKVEDSYKITREVN